MLRDNSLIRLPFSDKNDREAVRYFLDNKKEVKNKIIKSALLYYEKDSLFEYYKNYFRVILTYYPYSITPIISFIGWVPKIILAQINTHRTLSKNAGSSRAINIYRNIRNVIEKTYLPVFTYNKKGMTGDNVRDRGEISELLDFHIELMYNVIKNLINYDKIHKQNINRYLEPFMMVPVIITGTIYSYMDNKNSGWNQFIRLRYSEEAQEEIRYIAMTIKNAIQEYENIREYNLDKYCIKHNEYRGAQCDDDYFILIKKNNVHTPDNRFYELEENYYNMKNITVNKNIMALIGRIARVSTLTESEDIEKDYSLSIRLLNNGHMSPFEHVAVSMPEKSFYNYYEWKSIRYSIENNL